MSGAECWALDIDTDWCGEHDHALLLPDPDDPEMLVCERAKSESEWPAAWLAQRLREETCGLPGTDHGHTRCWLLNMAADRLDGAS